MKTKLGNASGKQAPTGQRWGRSLLGALTLSACHASVQADADTASDRSEEQLRDFDKPLTAPAVAPPADEGFSVREHALLGARHDLNYAGPKQATCKCLAVALYDHPNDPALQWELGAPRLDPTTQWIIALSSNDVACNPAPEGTLGASYQGYFIEGKDVVVYVEALGEGRPMTSGAVIPRPPPEGSVLVEAAGSVYGKPLDAKAKRCKLAPPTPTAP
jgi:hypothetical protein